MKKSRGISNREFQRLTKTKGPMYALVTLLTSNGHTVYATGAKFTPKKAKKRKSRGTR